MKTRAVSFIPVAILLKYLGIAAAVECFNVSGPPSSKPHMNPPFTKYISVFGVNVVATSGVPDSKVQHAANLMAQYLDNDEDGVVDDPLVAGNMSAVSSTLVMFKDSAEKDQLGNSITTQFQDTYSTQDLQADETIPDSEALLSGGTNSRFDAALEEILHLISDKGYAAAYPSALATDGTSLLTLATSKAIDNCGFAHNNTRTYPNCNGTYHYNDATCTDKCLATEYIYWLLTTVLGAQNYSAARCTNIEMEWGACSRTLLQTQDPDGYSLVTNPAYKLPTKLPDGTFNPSNTAVCQTNSSNTTQNNGDMLVPYMALVLTTTLAVACTIV